MGIGSGHAPECEVLFRSETPADGRILELGTLRWETDRPTHHKDWFPEASAYVLSDVETGTDVDVVSDAHGLESFDDMEFDGYLAISVYEHLRRPWIAAHAASRVLRPGGIALVVTHQTFPLHGYPNDFFRFSTGALAGIFEDAGMEILDAGYQYPCAITPPLEVTRWNTAAESYLNVAVCARRC